LNNGIIGIQNTQFTADIIIDIVFKVANRTGYKKNMAWGDCEFVFVFSFQNVSSKML